MSAASEIFITDSDQSDLKPGEEGSLVHQYQQVRSFPGSNRIDMRLLTFAAPAFGVPNEIQIPSMDLIAHRMYVEFNLGAESTVTGAKWFPTPTWVQDFSEGVQLLYNNTAVYSASSAELLIYPQFDLNPKQWLAQQDSMGFNQAADAADTAQKLYLDISPLAINVLSKVGPLAAYASNRWSVRVNLKAENLCMGSSTTSETPNAALTSMKLIILGTLAPPGEIAMAKDALDRGGIIWNFIKTVHSRQTLLDNTATAITYTANYNEIVGNLSKIRLLIRNKALLDQTTVSTKNNIAYQVYNGVNDSISVGRSSFPAQVYGQAISQPFVRNFAMLESDKNAGRFLSTASTVAEVDTGVIEIAFGESTSDLEFGTSSGSYPVKNDCQILLNIASDTVQDNYLDTVFYIHVRGVIGAQSANINLSA